MFSGTGERADATATGTVDGMALGEAGARCRAVGRASRSPASKGSRSRRYPDLPNPPAGSGGG